MINLRERSCTTTDISDLHKIMITGILECKAVCFGLNAEDFESVVSGVTILSSGQEVAVMTIS